MGVIHFQRLPNSSNHSIERVFASVRGALREVEIVVSVCPFESRGIFKRLCNIVYAWSQESDVNHITGDVHYIALLLRKHRTVLTVCDCGGMLRESGLRRRLFHLMWLKMPVARSAIVTVISEQTKQEVLRYTSCPEERIRVIPVPVGSEFQPAPKPFRSDRPTILQVGTGRNKNIERLTEAISGLQCRLDVVGPLSAEIQRRLARAGVLFEWASNLSDSEVAAKYRDADLVTFCSTYEGFGMPITEANAIGRPVVTSRIEPMVSVAGGAACLVDPYDPMSIRSGILRVIEDRHYREVLVRLGFENAKRFSAEAVAQSYMAVYRELGLPTNRPTLTAITLGK